MNQAWPTKRLADVCQILGGATPSKKNPKFYGGDIPWATVGDMNVEVITTTEEYITKAAVADCSTNVIPSGSIVMATRVGLGKVCVLGQDTAINQDLKGLTPKNTKELTTRWLFWWLKSKASDIQKAGTGATVQGVKMTFVQELEIPLPPLAEQKRIVALLDEAFAGIDEAKAKAESNWRDANTLFASRLEEIFAQAGLGWTQMRMEEVVAPDCSLSYGIVQPGDDFSEGMPVVRPTDLTSNVIYLSGLKRIDPKLAEGYARTTLQGGELLLCVRGSTGAVSIASEELAGANVTRGIVPIRFNKAMVLPDFGFYLISGGPVQAQIQEKTYGTALMQINIRDLRLISVSIPPLSEQNEIAQKMTDFHAKVQALTDLYERKATSFASLRNSLLTQAFAGELTA